jgi:hypothetical protein
MAGVVLRKATSNAALSRHTSKTLASVWLKSSAREAQCITKCIINGEVQWKFVAWFFKNTLGVVGQERASNTRHWLTAYAQTLPAIVMTRAFLLLLFIQQIALGQDIVLRLSNPAPRLGEEIKIYLRITSHYDPLVNQ